MFKISTTYQDLGLTLFPDGQDSFPQWLNIVASDGALILQYQQAMNQGNQTLANQILAQIPSASQKIVKATDVNKMNQCIQAVERFYGTDIEPYIENKQQEWTNIINQFSYKGNWSNSTQYYQNNMVTYSTGGVTFLYICTAQPPIGTPPTNTQYFRQATVVGVQGPAGPGTTFSEGWDSSTTYTANQVVTYGGGLWMSLKENTNVPPGSDSATWQLIMQLNSTVVPIQDTPPVVQSEGELWFNTQNNPTGYVKLDPLANPATANNIMTGFEAYNDEGDALVGTLDVYTKSESDAKYLHVDGSNAMTGDLNAGNNNVINVADPVNDNDAVNKKYFSENNLSAVIKTLPIADGYSVNQGDVVDISNNQVVKTMTAAANVENVINTSPTIDTAICKLNEQHSVMFYSYGSSAYVQLINNSDGTAASSVGGNNGLVTSSANSNLSLARLSDTQFVVSYTASNGGFCVIGSVSDTTISFGSAYMWGIGAAYSSPPGVIKISDGKIFIVIKNPDINNKVTGAVFAYSSTTTQISSLGAADLEHGISAASMVLLPDDSSGNHRVCVCFSDSGDGNKGKAVIATIDSANQVTWGDVVTWSDANITYLGCSSSGNSVLICASSSQTIGYGTVAFHLQTSGNSISLSYELKVSATNKIYIDAACISDGIFVVTGNAQATVVSIEENELSVGPEFSYSPGSFANYASIAAISQSAVIISYSDTGNSNYGTTTILEVMGNQIAGSFTDESSTAIALQSGTSGQSIECIFSGTTNASFVSEGQVIDSPGVYGVGVLDGILRVKPAAFSSITGHYQIGGTGGNNSVDINLGFKPSIVILYSTNNNSGANATGTAGNLSYTPVILTNALIQGTSGIWYSLTNSGFHHSISGTSIVQDIYYVAFK